MVVAALSTSTMVTLHFAIYANILAKIVQEVIQVFGMRGVGVGPSRLRPLPLYRMQPIWEINSAPLQNIEIVCRRKKQNKR